MSYLIRPSRLTFPLVSLTIRASVVPIARSQSTLTALLKASFSPRRTCTIGPSLNSGFGGCSCHWAFPPYTPTQSQTMDDLPFSPIAFDRSRSLSQYCCTRGSEIRLSVAVDGDRQSVGRTGSHTTKARTRSPECCTNSFSTAEAPCRQTVQVGDTRTKRRVDPCAPLNASWRLAKFAVVIATNGC